MRAVAVLAALVLCASSASAQRWWPTTGETVPVAANVVAGTCPAAANVPCQTTSGPGCCPTGQICGNGQNKCTVGRCCATTGATCNTGFCVGNDNNANCQNQFACNFGQICCSQGSTCKTWPDGSIGCSSACFSGDSMVETPNGKVALSAIKIGDKVLALNRKTHTFEFSDVYAMLDIDRTSTTDFIVVTTAAGSIELTAEHLIFSSHSEKGHLEAVPAHKLVVGDIVKTKDKKVHVVTKLDKVQKVGSYAPATVLGTIVVNDFVASCYAFTSHAKAHAALAPLRWLWASTPSELIKETPADGRHWYASFLHKRFAGLLDAAVV